MLRGKSASLKLVSARSTPDTAPRQTAAPSTNRTSIHRSNFTLAHPKCQQITPTNIHCQRRLALASMASVPISFTKAVPLESKNSPSDPFGIGVCERAALQLRATQFVNCPSLPRSAQRIEPLFRLAHSRRKSERRFISRNGGPRLSLIFERPAQPEICLRQGCGLRGPR